MSGDFERAFAVVVGHEGGLSLDPRDRGNWTDGAYGQKGGVLKGTKYGVAAHAYPSLDIRNLTLDQARDIYRANYWNRLGAETLPAPLNLVAFDTAINSGVGRAQQFLAQTRDWRHFLTLRLAFLKSLDSWETFGRGWQKRIDTLGDQAKEWEEQAKAPAQPATPASPEAVLDLIGVPGYDRVRIMKRSDGTGLKAYGVPEGKVLK